MRRRDGETNRYPIPMVERLENRDVSKNRVLCRGNLDGFGDGKYTLMSSLESASPPPGYNSSCCQKISSPSAPFSASQS